MNPPGGDAELLARGYIREVTTALESLNLAIVARIVEAMWTTYEADGQIFLIGNGGSAATCSHIGTDLAKGVLGHHGDAPARPVRARSLIDNVAVITAWANDVGFDHVFVGQLQTHLRRGDVVVALSASGNSPN
ncbi:MAG TPA: SIS domain-containing protein, partial [Chloroflexota bacterium]|nr:SIS domain-containing protein [Chloroflexota bacterium]